MAEDHDFDYSSICNELDNLSIKILKVLQTIILERQYLDDNLREGFINMAKSRYLMKERKISILQINTSNLLASKEVITDSNTVDGIKFTSFYISERKRSHSIPKESSSDAETIRIRNTKVNPKTKKNCSDDEGLQKDQKKVSDLVENPLNWFGVLVPNTLKTCQSKFEQTLETSAKIITLQNQLKALTQEYRRLRKQKSCLTT